MRSTIHHLGSIDLGERWNSWVEPPVTGYRPRDLPGLILRPRIYLTSDEQSLSRKMTAMLDLLRNLAGVVQQRRL